MATRKTKISAEATELLNTYLEEYDVEADSVTAEQAQQYIKTLDDDATYGADTFNEWLDAQATDEGEDEDDNDDDRAPASRGISTMDASATEFGRLLDTKENLVAYIHESVELDTKRRTLPAQTAFELKKELKDEELNGQPRPGTRYDDEPKPNTYDVRKPGEGSYYADVFASMKEGIEINKPLGLLKQILDPNNPIAVPAERKEWKMRTQAWLEAEKNMYDQRFKAGVKALKDAITILFRFMDVENKLTNVHVDFRTEDVDGEEVLERTTAPIRIYTEVKDKKTGKVKDLDKYFSIGAFLRASTPDQLKMIAVSGNHWDNFMPPKRARGRGKDKEPVTVTTANQAASAIADIAAGLTDATFKTAYVELLTSTDNDEELWDAHLLYVRLSSVLGLPSLKKRIDALAKAKEAAAKATDKKDAA